MLDPTTRRETAPPPRGEQEPEALACCPTAAPSNSSAYTAESGTTTALSLPTTVRMGADASPLLDLHTVSSAIQPPPVVPTNHARQSTRPRLGVLVRCPSALQVRMPRHPGGPRADPVGMFLLKLMRWVSSLPSDGAMSLARDAAWRQWLELYANAVSQGLLIFLLCLSDDCASAVAQPSSSSSHSTCPCPNRGAGARWRKCVHAFPPPISSHQPPARRTRERQAPATIERATPKVVACSSHRRGHNRLPNAQSPPRPNKTEAGPYWCMS